MTMTFELFTGDQDEVEDVKPKSSSSNKKEDKDIIRTLLNSLDEDDDDMDMMLG